jgi:hypothetical protein
MIGGGEPAKTKTTRRRRSIKKKSETAAAGKKVKIKAEKAEEPVADAEETPEESPAEEK